MKLVIDALFAQMLVNYLKLQKYDDVAYFIQGLAQLPKLPDQAVAQRDGK